MYEYTEMPAALETKAALDDFPLPGNTFYAASFAPGGYTMADNDWIYVLDETSLPEGGMSPVYPKGVNILLARVNGEIYALEGKCAHMGCPLFCGSIEGTVLTCPCHDWRFDIKTGKFLDAGELWLKVYQTRVEGGRMFVKITSATEVL